MIGDLPSDARSIVLVEGPSDRVALESVAERLGRTLGSDGVAIAEIGGAHAIARVNGELEKRTGLRLSGLVDRAEADVFRRAAASSTVLSLDRIHVCDADLEDELIRAMDASALEDLLATSGDLAAFRTFQRQAVWRDRRFDHQLHRWLRSNSGRVLRYAELIVAHCDDDRLPAPLVAAVDGA